MNPLLKDIYKRIWITKGCRFIASKYYLKLNKWSNLSISLLSIYVIISSILYILPDMPKILSNEYLNIISLSSSLILLVLSQLENTKEYKLKAYKMHQNAMFLDELYSKVIILNNYNTKISKEEIDLLYNEYHIILKQCDENHDDNDYQLFRAEHYHDVDLNISKSHSRFLKIWVPFKLYVYYILLILIPPTLLLLFMIF